MADGTVPSSDKFLIDQILPARDLALLYGPADSRKELLALRWVHDWSRSLPVLGFVSHPARFCYVSCQRTRRHTERDLKFLGIDPHDFPHVSLEFRKDQTLRDAYDVALGALRGAIPRLLVLDSITSLCEGNINYHRDASQFVTSVLHLCENNEVTVLGIATCGKDYGHYSSFLDLLPGSTAWAAGSGTKAHFSAIRGGNYRLRLWTRHGVDREQIYSLGDNGFTESSIILPDREEKMFLWLASLVEGAEVSSSDIHVMAEQVGWEKSRVYDWINEQIAAGGLVELRREARGVRIFQVYIERVRAQLQ